MNFKFNLIISYRIVTGIFLIFSSCLPVNNNKNSLNDSTDLMSMKKDSIIRINNSFCDSSFKELITHNYNSSTINFVGVYSDVRCTEDHCYGNSIELWRVENNIIGFLNIYLASIEPDKSGPIVFGKIENGKIKLTSLIKVGKGFKDSQKSHTQVYSFIGNIADTIMEGSFSIKECSNKLINNDKKIQLKLLKDDIRDNFSSYRDWKKYYEYELKIE